jgi:RNA polymerase sigma-70 factor (ECF subfamily)
VELEEHLFRRESGRLIAALTRIFGLHNLGLAEDVVQEAFCRAVEIWKVSGVPENPRGWLLATAKHRALDVLRNQRRADNFAVELRRHLESEWTLATAVDEAFSANAIADEQLRMMFSCCHPRLSQEAQVSLILNILCGFGAPEIAAAYLSGRAAVEKRISRGKKLIQEYQRSFDLSDAEFVSRLAAVQRALYLLFSEGYHGASAERAVRRELCDEALRLTLLLRGHPLASTPTTDALAALMCLDAARLATRVDVTGELSELGQQDRSRWDQELIGRGLRLLEESARGSDVSGYHVEAAIAAVHASSPSLEETDWPSIVALYDRLMQVAPSPIVALNRAIAVGHCEGPERGLAELHALSIEPKLSAYPFYAAALAEFELRLGNPSAACDHLQLAVGLARNPDERRALKRRLSSLQK